MRNFKTKFFAAIISFIVGVTAFYLTFDYYLVNVPETLPVKENSSNPNALPVKIISNKLEIRFLGFVQGERQIEAEFEVNNDTKENVYYYSYSKESYPFLTIKRNGKIVPDYWFRCGTGITKQTLFSGETVTFRVLKSDITYESKKNSEQESNEPTQVGFPFEIGDNPRKIFWSEAIKFPS